MGSCNNQVFSIFTLKFGVFALANSMYWPDFIGDIGVSKVFCSIDPGALIAQVEFLMPMKKTTKILKQSKAWVEWRKVERMRRKIMKKIAYGPRVTKMVDNQMPKMATSFRTWSLETLFVGRRRNGSRARHHQDLILQRLWRWGFAVSQAFNTQGGTNLGQGCKRQCLIIFGVSITKCSNRIWVYFSHSHSSTFISFFRIVPVFFSLSWRGPTRKATRILRRLGVPWLVFREQWLGTGCRGSVWYTMAPVPWICMDLSCLHIQWHSHHSLIPQFTGGFCVRSMWLSRKLARLTYRSHGLMKTPGRFNVTGRRGRYCWAATMLFTVQARCFRNVISLVRIG